MATSALGDQTKSIQPAIDVIKTFHENLMPEIDALNRKLLSMNDSPVLPSEGPVLVAAIDLIKTFNKTRRADLETTVVKKLIDMKALPVAAPKPANDKKPRVKKTGSDKTKKGGKKK